MISFNEMHIFNFDFQATLSAYVCYCITADQTLSLHFIVGGSVPVDLIFHSIKASERHIYFCLYCLFYVATPLNPPPPKSPPLPLTFFPPLWQGMSPGICYHHVEPPPPPFSVQGCSGGLRGGRCSRGYGSWGTEGIPTQWEQQGTQRGKV